MRMRDGLARGIAVGEQFAHPLPPAPRHWGAPTLPPDAAARCRRSLRAASKGGRRAGEGGGTWRGHGQGPLKELHNLASFCQKSVLGQSKVAYHDRCNRPHIPRELAPTTAPPPPSVWKPLKHVRKSPLGPPRGKRSCDRPEDSRFRRLLAQSNRSRAGGRSGPGERSARAGSLWQGHAADHHLPSKPGHRPPVNGPLPSREHRRAKSKARIANLRRESARRSYRSMADSCRTSSDRIVANFCGPCGVEVTNATTAPNGTSGGFFPSRRQSIATFSRVSARLS
jgi:hypothetical protein